MGRRMGIGPFRRVAVMCIDRLLAGQLGAEWVARAGREGPQHDAGLSGKLVGRKSGAIVSQPCHRRLGGASGQAEGDE